MLSMCEKQILCLCAHKPRPPSIWILLGFKYEMYHLKGDVGSSREGFFVLLMLFVLEKDNRNYEELERMVLPEGAGVAEHGQTHT